MRTAERGAVYSGDRTVGYRCATCGDVVDSMLGDSCSACNAKERRHREMIEAIKENNK